MNHDYFNIITFFNILDKEKEVHKETERLRRQINNEKKTQDELKKEIISLKSQLEESNQGLLAASRLSDQLEISRNGITALKDEGKVFLLFFLFKFLL